MKPETSSVPPASSPDEVAVSSAPQTGYRSALAEICVGLSVLAALATLLALVARWWWPFELLTHFRVQSTWMLLPLTVCLIVLKKYAVAVLAGGCLVWNLVLVAPAYFGPPSVTDSSVRLRLMSVNVHTGNRDYERFLQTVRAEDPDVLLVMEINDAWLQAIETLRGDYPYGESDPRPDNFGIGLFSKLPVADLKVRFIGNAGVPSIQARVQVGDVSVHLVGTHPLPPAGPNARLRNEQLAAAADLVSRLEGPVIVAGDLNITPWSPFFGDFLHRSGLRDSRRGFGVQATWPSNWGAGGIPIDHVLVSDEISVKNRHVGSDFGSDHLPLIVDLMVAAE